MSRQPLKIAKNLRQVQIWVHPEGMVTGSLYLAVTDDAGHMEDPRKVMNVDAPFLVMRRHQPDEIRFYNRSSIIRVEYDEDIPDSPQMTRLQCRMLMMDGSVIEGKIFETLPPDRARLYDYLNQANDRFIKLYTQDDRVCLLNKSYIIQVTI